MIFLNKFLEVAGLAGGYRPATRFVMLEVFPTGDRPDNHGLGQPPILRSYAEDNMSQAQSGE